MARFVNHYFCPHDGASWTDESDCTNNDRCPQCNAEIVPDYSDDITVGEQDFTLSSDSSASPLFQQTNA